MKKLTISIDNYYQINTLILVLLHTVITAHSAMYTMLIRVLQAPPKKFKLVQSQPFFFPVVILRKNTTV